MGLVRYVASRLQSQTLNETLASETEDDITVTTFENLDDRDSGNETDQELEAIQQESQQAHDDEVFSITKYLADKHLQSIENLPCTRPDLPCIPLARMTTWPADRNGYTASDVATCGDNLNLSLPDIGSHSERAASPPYGTGSADRSRRHVRHWSGDCIQRSSQLLQRPSLNFEKMQKNALHRKNFHNGVIKSNKKRISRLKAFSSSPPRFSRSPVMFSRSPPVVNKSHPLAGKGQPLSFVEFQKIAYSTSSDVMSFQRSAEVM